MNGIWQTLPPTAGNWLSAVPPLWAQTSPPADLVGLTFPASLLAIEIPADKVVSIASNLVGAIAILLLGWLIAGLVSAGIRAILKRSDLDNKLAGWTTGQRSDIAANVENWIAVIVFWVIMILAIVAALNVLNLTTVSQPLNSFLEQIFSYLPKLGAAAILMAVAWVLATVVRAVVIRMARSLSLDETFAQPADAAPAPTPFLLSQTLGNALYWFIFLFFLPLVLGVLDLQGPLQPVQNLLNDILAALPQLLKAGIIAVVGWLIARVVRGIVTNLLAATGIDQLGDKVGLNRTHGAQSLSWLIGTVVYVLILIPTATAALDAMAIPAVSAPATNMLNQILMTLPQIFTAALILVIAYVIGQFLAELVTRLLTGIGFNNIFYWLGLRATPYSPPPPLPETESDLPPVAPSKSPSEVVGIIILVGVMLFAAIAATNVLNIQALTAIVSGLLVIFGQVLAGLVVFAIGLYLANLAFNLISSSGSSQARVLGQTARIAIIALSAAMALQQMGIATSIVNLAFGLLLGAIAVAIALAFGLGGRDIAAEQVRQWLDSFNRKA